jgi:hypothetical protein
MQTKFFRKNDVQKYCRQFQLVATGLLLLLFCPLAAATPPHAASTHTWTLGGLTWSDAIQMPGCNKTGFTGSYNEPHCCSYTSGTTTWYYYNWPYVHHNATPLCPTPWRVPTRTDFDALANEMARSRLTGDWGYGGWCGSDGTLRNQGAWAEYWSSTEHSRGTAYYLFYDSGSVSAQNAVNKNAGFQVRCVKRSSD